MFGKHVVAEMISRSAENPNDRRRFLRNAGLAGLGVVGASTMTGFNTAASASSSAVSDGAILNFALNLEYLEAEFYSYAARGYGLPDSITHGKGRRGGVTGGSKVDFKTKAIQNIAYEIARDEEDHVRFLRAALGSAHVSRPSINIQASFTAAARAAGLVGPTQAFNPYANENNFLLAAFLFEDVGVTAYKGAAPLITNKTYLGAAAGILAVEGYHAGIIRTNLYLKGKYDEVRKLSDARDSLDGTRDVDRGIGTSKVANLTPTDHTGLAYSRTVPQVLNIVYLTPNKATEGGFFPHGVNGTFQTSGSNS
ncbi:MAG: ferritin-like domain-containing protein [Marmoricola sp.]